MSSELNRTEPVITPDRGLDLIINGGKRKKKPKTLEWSIEKAVNLFSKRLTVAFNFSFNLEQKQKS